MQNADWYVDLKCGEREPMFFFLLNAYLQSRIETGNESDGDEEVNVYMARLLQSLVDGRFYVDNAGYLAASPLDVAGKAEQATTTRGKVSIYRTNADCRLMEFGLFSGCGGYVSLYRQAMTPQPAETYLKQAEQFYAWAALLCSRMPTRYRGLSLTLYKLAEGFDAYRHVLRHMAGNHLGLLYRLSPGQLWHLERAANAAALPAIKEQALDRMLDAYNRWVAEPTADNRRLFMEASEPYCQLKPGFNPASLVPEPPAEGGSDNEN